MELIKKCSNLLETTPFITDNWYHDLYSKCLFEDELDVSFYIGVLEGEVNALVDELFVNLNLSVLQGEYTEYQDYLNELEQIESHSFLIVSSAIGVMFRLPHEGSAVEAIDPELIKLQTQIDGALNNELFKPISDCISLMKGLTTLCLSATKFEATNLSLIKGSYIDENLIGDNSFEPEVIKALKISLEISRIDFLLTVDEWVFERLFVLKSVLDRMKSTRGTYKSLIPVLNVLVDKCDFIALKIFLRIKSDQELNHLLIYNINADEMDTVDFEVGIFKPLQRLTDNHYSIVEDYYKNSEIKEIRSKFNEETAELTLREIHIYVKHLKDKEQNIEILTKVVRYFDLSIYASKSKTKDLSGFDKYSLKIFKNYLHNNRFSRIIDDYLLKISDFDLSKLVEIEGELNKIKEVQHETGLENYFPYKKFCEFLCALLENKFDSTTEIVHSETDRIIGMLNSYLIIAYNKYRWCKVRGIKAVQFPKNECSSVTCEGVGEVFINSSFVLPINYKKVQVELQNLGSLRDKYNVLNDTHRSLKKHKDSIKELEKNSKDSEKRSIEILGIFSAVVLFAVGNIQIFTGENVTFEDSLRFMLVFGYCLVLFVFLIWLITNDGEKRKLRPVHYVSLIALIISTVMALAYMFNSDESDHSKNDPKTNGKMTTTESRQEINTSDSLEINSVADSTPDSSRIESI